MAKRQKGMVFIIIILFYFLLAAQTDKPNRAIRSGDASAQHLDLLRPRYGESPHFPRDYVIGALGRCDASEESYRYAKLLVSGLASGNGRADGVDFPEQKRLSVLREISDLRTRGWRVGGGRIEPDGSVSYLIRFLGRESSVTGELYLRREEPKSGRETDGAVNKEETASFSWRVDDILLESPRNLSEGKFGPTKADMPSYERFF
jgi:hypothetical protein